MMRTIHAFAVCFAAAAASTAVAQPKPYEVKSGILESASDAFGGKTTTTLYFDDFGRKQATYTTTALEMAGMKSVTHNLTIQLPDGTSYNIDLDQKTGTRMRLDPKAAAAMAAALAPQLATDAKVQTLPEKVFLGKTCKGMQAQAMGIPAKVWTWKGLPLYSEAQMGTGAPIVTKATKLSVDVPVAADKFAVPAGVQIQDVGGP